MSSPYFDYERSPLLGTYTATNNMLADSWKYASKRGSADGSVDSRVYRKAWPPAVNQEILYTLYRSHLSTDDETEPGDNPRPEQLTE